MDEDEARRILRRRGRAELDEIFGVEFMAKRDATTTDFNAPLRALSEEFAYAMLWSRPGLGRRERSLVTLAMLCALDRPQELRMHVGAALNNGVTLDEIREVLTHAAAYCGLPAALDALGVAERALRETGRLPPSPDAAGDG